MRPRATQTWDFFSLSQEITKLFSINLRKRKYAKIHVAIQNRGRVEWAGLVLRDESTTCKLNRCAARATHREYIGVNNTYRPFPVQFMNMRCTLPMNLHDYKISRSLNSFFTDTHRSLKTWFYFIIRSAPNLMFILQVVLELSKEMQNLSYNRILCFSLQ